MKAILYKYKKSILIITGLIGLYALLGFFAVPYAIKAKVPDMVHEMTAKEATLDDAEFNPFSLTLSLSGFAIKEPEGKKIIGLKELYVNYGLWTTIKHLAVSIDEFRLTEPYTSLVIGKDGSINLANLVKTDDAETEEEDPSDELFQIWIKDIKIDKGQLDFVNLSNPTPYHTQFQPLNLHIENLTTIESMHAEDDSFALEFDEGSRIEWQGSISFVPEIKSVGKITISNVQGVRLWEAIKDRMKLRIRDGALDLETEYAFAMGDEISLFKLSKGQAKLTDLGISSKDSEQQLIRLADLSVQGISYDYLSQQLSIENVSSNKAYALTQINKDGQLNLMALYKGDVAHEVYETAVGLKPDEKSMQVSVKHIELKNYHVDVTHETSGDPVQLKITPIDIDITGLSTRPGSKFNVTTHASINESGKINAEGTVGLDPVEVKMDIKGEQLALKPFQPYLAQSTKLKLVHGSVNFDNKLNLSLPQQGDLKLVVTGNAGINKLKTVAAADNKDFLKWRSVNLEKIKFALSPLQLDIATIDVNQLISTFIINTDKTTNVSRIFSAPEKPVKTSQTVSDAPKKSEPFVLNIKVIKVRDSASFFADRGLVLPFATDIKSLHGTIKNISNDKRARSSIDLRGKVDRTAPVLIAGSFEPFDIENYLDINMQFKDISMTSFTPYMAQFGGYKVEKGKLTVELDYNIKKKELQAENKVTINQLTLGDEVESPDSVNLPVKLAISLLKDMNGNINLDLPVHGSLDDPEFSIWGLVGDALLNMLTKVVTAPFSMIAGLVGSDADLSRVIFNKGRFELQEEQQQNLQAIVKGLQQRPQLQLEIRGIAYREEDGYTLSEDAIMMQIKTAKWNDLYRFQRPDSIDDLVLSDEDYHEFLAEVYEERFSKRADVLIDKAEDAADAESAKQIYAQMLQQLIEDSPVDDVDLNRLADKRASAILKYITDQDAGLKKRMFLLNHEVKASAEEGEIFIDLKLGAGD